MNKDNDGLNDAPSPKKAVPNITLQNFTNDDCFEKENHSIDNIKNLMERCKIDLTEKLSPPPIAMQIANENGLIALCTKGNFSIITGAAKSRKTFLLSMLLAAAVKGSFQDTFICEGKGVNILFDTEQSSHKTQQVGHRICQLSETNNPENLKIYTLRAIEPSERIRGIEEVLSTTPNIKFVAIDGIIDLDIDPILQADQAQNIISKLMKWTEIYNIHISCILHYNKNASTLLGHLGSFSHRKADAVIEVSKSKEDSNVSLVKSVDCREQEFNPFAFSVDQTGMPYILHGYSFQKSAKVDKGQKTQKPKAITPVDLDPNKHIEILFIVFKIQKEQGYNDLWRNIKNAGAELGITIGDNRARDFIPYYIQHENIIKSELPTRKTFVYTLAGQRNIEFKDAV